MTPDDREPLGGASVLVTRPESQSAALCDRIRERGGEALALPTITIEPLADLDAVESLAREIEDHAAVIFASANAARIAVPVILGRGRTWPVRVAAIAVGEGTARELRRLGISNVIAPQDGADSEAVLRLDALAEVTGRRVAIIGGVGGRRLLHEVLARRGARVSAVECYVRHLPSGDVPAAVRDRIAADELAAVIVTSSEGVRNLYRMVGSELASHLRTIPHFVSHPRIAAAARENGAADVVMSEAGDAALVDSLVRRLCGTGSHHRLGCAP